MQVCRYAGMQGITQMLKHTGLFTIALIFAARAAFAAELPKALIDPYLQVQAALAGDKFDEVALHAKAIEVAATALGSDADKLVAGAKKLSAAKDIAAARTVFGELSEALIAYAEKTKSELGADVKVAYCPMVNKPWLQKDKDIKNPYYGASMLTCGSFKN
jgi:Protein of unknown function (DUF3347)